MGSASEQNVLDETTEDLVREEQVHARDETGDQDDGGALDQLVLPGPVDLLQLRPRLGDEALAALPRDVASVGGCGRRRRARLLLLLLLLLLLRLALLRRALERGAALGLRGAAGAALRTGLSGHLASLPVDSVPATPATVLLELDPVRRVPLRLLGLVVAPLAVIAGERDSDSYSGCHSCSLLLRVLSRR